MRHTIVNVRGNFGDLVVMSGVAGALKADGDQMHIFTRKELRAVEILQHMGCFDSVHYFEHMPINPNRVDECEFTIELRSTPWLYPVSLLRTGKVVNVSHVPGFEGMVSAEVDESIHERYAMILGVPKGRIRPGKWIVRPEEALMAKNWIRQNTEGDGPVVFFQYHATSPERRLPPKIVEEVYDGLTERGLRVVLAYIDRGNSNYLGLVTRRACACSLLPLPISCAVMAQAALVISSDTGFFHLAGSLTLPTVGVFGPTNYDVTARYYPLTRKARPSQVLPCANCYYRPWRGWERLCAEDGCRQMALHSAEAILSEVDAMLGLNQSQTGVSIQVSRLSAASRARVTGRCEE